MARLEWTEDLNTGIEVIDGQHKRIVEYINRLHDARILKKRNMIGEVITATVDYTLSHFSFEEALMEDAGYEFTRPHKKVHELFIRRVSEYQQRFKDGEDVAEELYDLLARWLFNHIRHDDASYVKSVKSNMKKLATDKGEGGWLSRSINKFFK
ncbi:MAG: bacteriohemerythrin [Candidatus Thiodiazotropha sp. (ex Monitilora ramsayi)]|nr:bacteriohemerythrin [Candidatus Thiodiazotropha sp. (ex Monitilora ramsayi)]